jgi:PAS domain-containing protein
MSDPIMKSLFFIILTLFLLHFLLKLRDQGVDRKESEDRLRLYARVINKSSEGIMITDHRGTIIAVNPAFTTITGYTDEEVAGQSARILHSGIQDTEFYMYMWVFFRILRNAGKPRSS